MIKKPKSTRNHNTVTRAKSFGAFQLSLPKTLRDVDGVSGGTGAKYYTNPLVNSSFNNNTMYFFNPMSQIPVGTGTGYRNGNTVYLDSMDLRGQVTGAYVGATAQAESYRFLCIITTVQAPSGGTGFNISTGTNLVPSAVFLNPNDPYSSPVDPRLAHCMFDKVYDVHVFGSTTGNEILSIHDHIPFHVEYEYQGEGSTAYGVSSNIYVVVIPKTPNVANGTSLGGPIATTLVTNFKEVAAAV